MDSKCIAQRKWVKLRSRSKKCYFHSPLELFWLTMTSQIEILIQAKLLHCTKTNNLRATYFNGDFKCVCNNNLARILSILSSTDHHFWNEVIAIGVSTIWNWNNNKIIANWRKVNKFIKNYPNLLKSVSPEPGVRSRFKIVQSHGVNLKNDTVSKKLSFSTF